MRLEPGEPSASGAPLTTMFEITMKLDALFSLARFCIFKFSYAEKIGVTIIHLQILCIHLQRASINHFGELVKLQVLGLPSMAISYLIYFRRLFFAVLADSM